jgi:hypothetical protein
MRAIVALRIAALLLLGSPPAVSQIVIHEERDWGCPTPCIPAGFPCTMGDYDEQAFFPPGVIPPTIGGYAGPIGCGLAPPFPTGPFGFPGATLWHTETDCCAAAVPPAAPFSGCFAAYNHGAAGGPFGEPPFTYLTLAAAGGPSIRNTGAISSYGIGAVAARPPTPTGPGQEIILCFDYVKVTEGGGTPSFDTCFVEIRGSPCGEPCALDPTAGPPWTSIAVLAGNNPCTAPLTCCVGPFHPALDDCFIAAPGDPLDGSKIRFRFDTRDAVNNAFCGWNVDNVLLTNEECVPCAAAGGGSIVSSGGEPVPGNACFALGLDGGPPFGFTFLVIGAANMPPVAGCSLCCAPLIILGPFPTDGFGDFTLPLALPAGLAPCGPSFCLQWVTLAPVPPGVFPSTAGKLRIQIG